LRHLTALVLLVALAACLPRRQNPADSADPDYSGYIYGFRLARSAD